MRPHTVGFIFARGGSKGIHRKNLRMLAGKPLVAHAIEIARASNLIDRVVVSTDDSDIADVARLYGAEVPFLRPSELAMDNAPEWLAWQHAIRAMEAAEGDAHLDVFVSVPPTSPLRQVEDVDRCIQALLQSDADVVVTVKPAERNPYFNMVVVDDGGYARLAMPSGAGITRRQDAPTVYDLTSVAYAARPDFVLTSRGIFDGKVRAVVIPAERSLDIDTELDLRIAEFLYGLSSTSSGSGEHRGVFESRH